MLYPLIFEPLLVPMVWGGERILSYKGLAEGPEKVGESWEVSAVPGRESTVASGSLRGRSLPSLVEEFKGALVGKSVYERFGGEFPLLVKFIDASGDLSIQVHPDDEMARRVHGKPFGKTEMWYVMDSAPKAHLYSGFSREITPREYDSLVASGKIVDVLTDHPVKEGDVFFIPAGRVHAICAGTFLAEIQQSGDLTYRVFDYNRPGLDGKPRQLHTALAREALDYKVYPSYRTDYEPAVDKKVPLVECNCFTTDLYVLDAPLNIPLEDLDSFLVVMCMEGECVLEDSEPLFGPDGLPTATKGHVVRLGRGTTVLVPATSRGITLKPASPLVKILTSHC